MNIMISQKLISSLRKEDVAGSGRCQPPPHLFTRRQTGLLSSRPTQSENSSENVEKTPALCFQVRRQQAALQGGVLFIRLDQQWPNILWFPQGSMGQHASFFVSFILFLKAAMRRCGQNPTDIEVSDIINKIHNDSGSLDLEVKNYLNTIF